jgi:hypothetical protein
MAGSSKRFRHAVEIAMLQVIHSRLTQPKDEGNPEWDYGCFVHWLYAWPLLPTPLPLSSLVCFAALPAASFDITWPNTAKLQQSPGPEARVPQMPKLSLPGAALGATRSEPRIIDVLRTQKPPPG